MDQGAFITWLKQYGINVIVDVRKMPLSRKRGFSKTILKETLAQNNISYFHFNELGASKELRNELAESGNYKSFFRQYKKNLCDHTQQLDEIRYMIDKGKKVALLCFEQDPQKCHRSVVADAIIKRDGNGMQLTHIDHFVDMHKMVTRIITACLICG